MWCLLSLLQPHVLHSGGSGALCSRRLARSRLWLRRSLPTVSIHSNLLQQISHSDVRAKPSQRGLKPYLQWPLSEGKGGKKRKRRKMNLQEKTGLDGASVCSRLSATDCVPAQLAPAVLLNMLNFSSAPSSGCDHSTAKRYKDSTAWGVLCSAFLSLTQQQQWREGAERPTQLLRLTYTTMLPSLIPPSHTLRRSLSHSRSNMPYSPLLMLRSMRAEMR